MLSFSTCKRDQWKSYLPRKMLVQDSLLDKVPVRIIGIINKEITRTSSKNLEGRLKKYTVTALIHSRIAVKTFNISLIKEETKAEQLDRIL